MRDFRRWTFLVVVAALVVVPLSEPPVAKVFGNPTASGEGGQQSRDASAMALEGLAKLVDGLRDHEQDRIDAARQKFNDAARLFFEASSRIKSITFPPQIGDRRYFDVILPEERQVIEHIAKRRGRPIPQTLAELYDFFGIETASIGVASERTARMSASVSILIEQNFGLDLAYYFILGTSVTRAFTIALR